MIGEEPCILAGEDSILKRLRDHSAANVGCLLAFVILAAIITLSVTGRITFWASWHTSLKIISTILTVMVSVWIYFFIVVLIDTVLPKKARKKPDASQETAKD
jgi:uncharacterized BrkB/YihY/UPF0761 family membrane protein